MKIADALMLVALMAPGFSTAGTQNQWIVGVEREVEPGTYYSLVQQNNGWRLWRMERKSGIECIAVKPAVGRHHPDPYTAYHFRGGTPFILIVFSKRFGESSNIRGRHGAIGALRQEVRAPGERFWTKWSPKISLDEITEDRLEVNVVSAEYPSILVGIDTERAIIDMKGLSAIRQAGGQCAAG